MTTIGHDTFTRGNVATGWGTASDGQTWSLLLGGSSHFAVTSNEGQVTNAFGQANLGSATATAFDITCRVQVNNASDLLGPTARVVDSNNYYWLYLVPGFLVIRSVVAGSNNDITSTTFSTTLGAWYWMHFKGNGTTLQGNIWADGGSEPGGWMVSTTDSTFASGNFGLLIWSKSASADQVDSFLVTDGSSAPVVVPKTWGNHHGFARLQ